VGFVEKDKGPGTALALLHHSVQKNRGLAARGVFGETVQLRLRFR
jgi:hypothetical protein